MPRTLRRLQAGLLAAHGRQHWWPARTRFEVLVGAVLTQHTAWTGVEKAIAELRAAQLLDPSAILAAGAELTDAIRPAGVYNVKTTRLRALCQWFVERGGFAGLDAWATAELRPSLLGVHGVGRETADAILIYAFRRPVFVVDAYTRRILIRMGELDDKTGYEALRTAVQAAAPGQTGWFNELHALLVVHAKAYCRPRPRCLACPLRADCATGRQARDQELA